LAHSSDSKRANLIVLASTAFLRGAHNSVFNVIWQPFVLSLGASMSTLGLLNSLGGMNGIITTIAQPAGGWLADRVGRKPFLIASSILLILGYSIFALAGWLNLGAILLIGLIPFGLSALANPARNSLTAESTHSSKLGSAFSLIMLASIVPGIVAPTLGGWFVDRFGYISIFPIAILLEVIGLVLVWRLLKEARVPNASLRPTRASIKLVFSVPMIQVVGFFLAAAGDSFSWGMGWGILNGMLRKNLAFSVAELGIMASISSLTWAIVQMPIGRYIDKHGTHWMLVFSECLGIPLMLIYLTQTRFEIFAVSQILFGLTAATWVPTISTHLTRIAGVENRSSAFGWLNLFRGVISFPASAIGGFLYDAGGMQLPLIANLIGCCVVVTILLVLVREPKPIIGAQINADERGY
jgi:MFS family permease